MGVLVTDRRRTPADLAGCAVVVGMVASVPVALATLAVTSVGRMLLDGADLGQVVRALPLTDPEDAELVPVLLLGAVVLGGLAGLASGAVWSAVRARPTSRTGTARLLAAGAAALVPLTSLLVGPSWPLAVLPAGAAGVVALVALPRLERAPARPPGARTR